MEYSVPAPTQIGGLNPNAAVTTSTMIAIQKTAITTPAAMASAAINRL